MYKTLGLDCSLFIVNETILNEYKQLAARYTVDQQIEENLVHSTVDNWSVAFHIWSMFYEKEKSLLLDYQKMMAYSCNFYCLELLRKSKAINNFFAMYGKSEATVFLLSYEMAVQMLNWTYGLLTQYEEGQLLIEKNMERDYFLLFDKQQLKDDEEHVLYKEQKLVTSLLAQSYSTDDQFNQYVGRAIVKTKGRLVHYRE